MRRRCLGEPADRQRVEVLLKADNPGWQQTRLTALKMGFNNESSNAFIAESLGVSEASVKPWFAAFRSDGIEAALDRKYGIGRPTGLNEEIEAYLMTGLENARWNTAVQARDELEAHFKRRFTYHRVWHWLKKCAGVLRVPRPVHEKRDSAKAEAFKRNFLGILRRLQSHGRSQSRSGLLMKAVTDCCPTIGGSGRSRGYVGTSFGKANTTGAIAMGRLIQSKAKPCSCRLQA